jgi:hypothetical protein
MPAPPPLDIAAVVAYCEERDPPHALHQVRMEAVLQRELRNRRVTLPGLQREGRRL